MQHAVFAALFVVQYELHGNARLAGPVRLRRVAAVSDQVSRIIRTSHGNSGISNDCVSIVDCSRQYGINKARQQAETSMGKLTTPVLDTLHGVPAQDRKSVV